MIGLTCRECAERRRLGRFLRHYPDDEPGAKNGCGHEYADAKSGRNFGSPHPKTSPNMLGCPGEASVAVDRGGGSCGQDLRPSPDEFDCSNQSRRRANPGRGGEDRQANLLSRSIQSGARGQFSEYCRDSTAQTRSHRTPSASQRNRAGATSDPSTARQVLRDTALLAPEPKSLSRSPNQLNSTEMLVPRRGCRAADSHVLGRDPLRRGCAWVCLAVSVARGHRGACRRRATDTAGRRSKQPDAPRNGRPRPGSWRAFAGSVAQSEHACGCAGLAAS